MVVKADVYKNVLVHSLHVCVVWQQRGCQAGDVTVLFAALLWVQDKFALHWKRRKLQNSRIKSCMYFS